MTTDVCLLHWNLTALQEEFHDSLQSPAAMKELSGRWGSTGASTSTCMLGGLLRGGPQKRPVYLPNTIVAHRSLYLAICCCWWMGCDGHLPTAIRLFMYVSAWYIHEQTDGSWHRIPTRWYSGPRPTAKLQQSRNNVATMLRKGCKNVGKKSQRKKSQNPIATCDALPQLATGCNLLAQLAGALQLAVTCQRAMCNGRISFTFNSHVDALLWNHIYVCINYVVVAGQATYRMHMWQSCIVITHACILVIGLMKSAILCNT
jgi:hypothetical protein